MKNIRTIVWALLAASLAAALCFVPLFDLLSYEFSFAVGLLAAFGAAHLAADRVARARIAAEAVSAWGLFGRAALTNAAVLLVAPLLLITLNAARVKVCDYPGGLAFYALLPGVTVLCSSALGTACGLAFHRRGAATSVAVLVVLGSLGLSLYRFYAAPPIFAYDPFGGYFPGAIYDEDVRVEAPLLLARLQHVLAALALVAGAALLHDTSAQGLRLRLLAAPERLPHRLLFAALLVSATTLHALGPRLGFRQDADTIARALGGRRDTPHFTIYYSKTGEAARAIDLVVRDHEHAYALLERTLGVRPPKITSFVFDSQAQKRRLMGAGRVQVAKPWRREIYLQYERFPHPVLRHELAHVFAGEFAPGPFRVPFRLRGPGPLVSVGLLEGVAEAASWTGGGTLTPHEWAHALDALGKRPPLRRIFGLGFFGANPAMGYTLAGSFCRYLLDTRGAARLREAYRSGDVERAYGQTLEGLEREWVAFVRSVPVRPEDLELARDRFQRPAVIAIPCAHAVASRRRHAAGLAHAGAYAEAIEQLRAACRDAPSDPDVALDLAWVLGSSGALEAAMALVRDLGARPFPRATRARVLSLLADIQMRAGRDTEARATLETLLGLPADDSLKRSVTARLLALSDARLREPLGSALSGTGRGHADSPLLLLRLREAVAAAPEQGIGPYLLGRQLLARGLPTEALPWLLRARDLPLPDARFRLENLRLLGHAAYQAGEQATAGAAFLALRDDPASRETIRLEAADMLERLELDRGFAETRPFAEPNGAAPAPRPEGTRSPQSSPRPVREP